MAKAIAKDLREELSNLVSEQASEPKPRGQVEDWQQIRFRVTGLTPGSDLPRTKLVDATGHFDIVFISASVSPIPAPGQLSLKIRKGESGAFFTSEGDSIDILNTVGLQNTAVGFAPYFIKGRLRIGANTNIMMEFINETAGVTFTFVEIVFHGIKVLL